MCRECQELDLSVTKVWLEGYSREKSEVVYVKSNCGFPPWGLHWKQTTRHTVGCTAGDPQVKRELLIYIHAGGMIAIAGVAGGYFFVSDH